MWCEKMVPIESPRPQGRGGHVGHLLRPHGNVDVGQVHLRLDRLDVHGDGGLGHPGERTAQYPQQLVPVGPDGIGLEDEGGEFRVPIGEHRTVLVGYHDAQCPPQ